MVPLTFVRTRELDSSLATPRLLYRVSSSSGPRWPGTTQPRQPRQPLSGPWFASKLALSNVWDGHTGCVNCLSWNLDGSRLVSGSDDTRLCIWDYPARETVEPDTDNDVEAHWNTRKRAGIETVRDGVVKKPRAKIATGHRANIFGCRFMPYSNDSVLASCAGDSEVRVHMLRPSAPGSDGTLMHVFSCHTDRAKRLQLLKQSPSSLLSCSEDGTVRHHDLRLPNPCTGSRKGTCAPIVDYSPYGVDLHSLAVNPVRQHIFVVAGTTRSLFLHDFRKPSEPFSRLTPLEPSELVTDKRQDDGVANSIRGSVTAAAWSPDGTCVIGNWSSSWVYGFEGVDGIRGSDDGLGGFQGSWKWSGWSGDRKKEEMKKRKKSEVGKGGASTGTSEDSSDESKAKKSPRVKSPEHERDESLEENMLVDDEMSSPPPLVKPEELERLEREPSEVVGANKEGLPDETIGAKPVERDEEDDSDDEYEDIDSADEELEEEEDDNEESNGSEPTTPSDHDTPAYRRPPPGARANPTGAFAHIPSVDTYDRVYRGAVNVQTVKDCSFLSNSLVSCGSDDGNLFIFSRNSCQPCQILRGDTHVVNVAVAHPNGQAVAVSGIDRTVKVFEPVWGGLRRTVPGAKAGGVDEREDGKREHTRNRRRGSDDAGEIEMGARGSDDDDDEEDDDDDDEEGPWGLGYRSAVSSILPSLVSPLPSSISFRGPADEAVAFPRSWSLLDHADRITHENDRRRKGGGSGGTVRLSSAMIMRLLGRMRERMPAAQGEDEEEEEGEEGEGECQVQ